MKVGVGVSKARHLRFSDEKGKKNRKVYLIAVPRSIGW